MALSTSIIFQNFPKHVRTLALLLLVVLRIQEGTTKHFKVGIDKILRKSELMVESFCLIKNTYMNSD